MRRKALVIVLLKTLFIVAVSEFIIMYLLSHLRLESILIETAIDTSILTIVITPLIWFFVIRKFEQDRSHAINLLSRNYDAMMNISKLSTLGEVSKGLAHEMNNPLQIIIGAGQVLSKDKEQKISIWGLKISDAGKRISKILKGLLIFTGIEGADRGKKVDIREIIQDFHEFVLPKIEERGIHFRVVVNLKGEYFFDDASIFHILANLFQNAIEAIRGNRPVFELEIRDENGFMVISFSDNGAGVDKAIADKIFDPFFTTKQHQKSTGLGLTLVKGIASRNKGEVKIVSFSNPTKFEISLKP